MVYSLAVLFENDLFGSVPSILYRKGLKMLFFIAQLYKMAHLLENITEVYELVQGYPGLKY